MNQLTDNQGIIKEGGEMIRLTTDQRSVLRRSRSTKGGSKEIALDPKKRIKVKKEDHILGISIQ